MAAPKLSDEQRSVVLEWIAADYSGDLILHWIAQRRATKVPIPDEGPEKFSLNPEGWPEITKQTLAYYRKSYGQTIKSLREKRHTAALDTGLALKAERVAQLKELADQIKMILWVADPKSGRLWNVTVWREILDDIAREMGHRRQGIDITLERELEAFLDRLRDNLDEETYARVLALAAGSAAD